MNEEKKCAVCGKSLSGLKSLARYCSNRCRQEKKYDKKRVRPKPKVVDFS